MGRAEPATHPLQHPAAVAGRGLAGRHREVRGLPRCCQRESGRWNRPRRSAFSLSGSRSSSAQGSTRSSSTTKSPRSRRKCVAGDCKRSCAPRAGTSTGGSIGNAVDGTEPAALLNIGQRWPVPAPTELMLLSRQLSRTGSRAPANRPGWPGLRSARGGVALRPWTGVDFSLALRAAVPRSLRPQPHRTGRQWRGSASTMRTPVARLLATSSG